MVWKLGKGNMGQENGSSNNFYLQTQSHYSISQLVSFLRRPAKKRYRLLVYLVILMTLDKTLCRTGNEFAAYFQKNYYAQQKQIMCQKLIKKVIGNTSLNLDPGTVTDVVNFMATFVGDNSKIQIVKIYACTAIVCECKKMPSVNAEALVPTGVTIEKIMNCVRDIPREEFFSLLYLIASKWPDCPKSLYHKIDSLKTSYRIFKKYRVICQAIGKEFDLPDNINSLLSSFGWLIYLIAIMQEDEIDKLEIIPDILSQLIVQLYVSCLKCADEKFVQGKVSTSFPFSSLSPSDKRNVCKRYHDRYWAIIRQVCQMRGYNQPIDQFVMRPQILQRLIDDLSSEYLRKKELEYQWSIDESSFLALNKTLTPEAFRFQKFQQLNYPIQRLKFQGERMNQSNLTEHTQNNMNAECSTPISTPLSTKLESLAWIRNCIESLTGIDIERAKICYERFRSQSYEDFLREVDLKLNKAIEVFTPKCRDFSHRKTEIFKFFTCCITIIIQMYSQSDLRQIYQSTGSVLSILSLCTEIFNFCYQARVGNYKEYCDIFGISLICGFEPINWFGRFLKLPFGVSEHLLDLQRRLVIIQIWQNNIGMPILQRQKIQNIQDQNTLIRMQKRLQYHIRQRIRNICDETIGNYHSDKMFKIMQIFMKQQPAFVAGNNIDKIVICCITSILCLNKKSTQSEAKIMQQVIDQYRKIPLSYEVNIKEVDDQSGRIISIVDFYNQCFLERVQGMIANNGRHFQTLRPIQSNSCDLQSKKQTVGFASNAKTESVFSKKSRDIQGGVKNLQQKLAKNIFLSTGQALSQVKNESSDMMDESEERAHSGSF